MKRIHIFAFILIFLTGLVFVHSCSGDKIANENSLLSDRSKARIRKDFKHPPLRLKSRPLWFWNTPLSREQTLGVMKAARDSGYYGLGIVPSHGMTPEYMSPEFLDHYKYAVETADSLGMKLCLYDEFYFPSGTAGGNLVKQYPGAVSKRLDKMEFNVKGPGLFSHPLQEGAFMGAVAMDNNTLDRIDLSGCAYDGYLQGELPGGTWKVMMFTLAEDTSSGRNHVDYLSPGAVERFIELTYDKFYRAFPDHFGSTIDFAFYDEPTMRWVEGGRTWTGSFNQEFEDHYGYNPVIYYPALWYDIGPETAAARNTLFGFRAGLYASGFPKTINDWCREHGIQLAGHVDQEEILNPVSSCGDLIKAFKYQDIPTIDQIFYYGRASKVYKVVSSAATNYDRPLVATECYGAMRDMPVENLCREAMDQFAKGINLMEPHAVWYSDKIDIQPDLSPADSIYGAYITDYNEYIGRLQCLLQGGEHVADIGILYPIASLQGSYCFGPGDPGWGGVTPAEADYLDIGEMLSLKIRKDFTYIHPEILDNKCRIEDRKIHLLNQKSPGYYKVLIIPGSRTIHWSNLKQIQSFYNLGGVVIATSVLPEQSAEFGKSGEVQQAVKEIFGEDAYTRTDLTRISASSTWNNGGFIPAYALDGHVETSWRPSHGKTANEWLEIDFGREMIISRIQVFTGRNQSYRPLIGFITKDGDQDFSFRVLFHDGIHWQEAGNWTSPGIMKPVPIPLISTSKIRLLIDSGEEDNISIQEVEIFDDADQKTDIYSRSYIKNTNEKGGKAYFIPVPNPALLKDILDEAISCWDIRFEEDNQVSGGNLSCIHKRLRGMDIYFFANSSESEVNVPVVLDGKLELEQWDPHDGSISSYDYKTINRDGNRQTRFMLELGPVRSVFFVAD